MGVFVVGASGDLGDSVGGLDKAEVVGFGGQMLQLYVCGECAKEGFTGAEQDGTVVMVRESMRSLRR